MPLTLDTLNEASAADAMALLDGIYEHSPWVAEAALRQRPFRTLAQLKYALAQAVAAAPQERQLALLRAHPELAGKAMVQRTLTPASSGEQQTAGLTACTPEEFERLQTLNAQYNTRFGWPFILAVRGPRGTGLNRAQIIASFERRLRQPKAVEFAECLRQVHRIAELRLNERFGYTPARGNLVWDWLERLARHSDPGYAERGELTVTYLTEAHRACAAEIAEHIRANGFDEVAIDAVGNVVGRYHPAGGATSARYLLTGSHYDTVRHAGKYDGRLGIFVPMACVRELAAAGRRLPFGIELVAFAEEEGQRFKATFLGSGALVGDFRPEWLEQRDADGVSLRVAMQQAGLDPSAIPALRRDPRHYLGFVEVHIEQGPVLHALNLPLGVVRSINGSARFDGAFIGVAAHAGTTPMDQRHDAAVAAAELVLAVQARARADDDSVGTVGRLEVPDGSVNVIPGRCRFTLDLRAPTDPQRDALIADVLGSLADISARHGVEHTLEETMRAAAAPSDPAWQARWEAAVAALGLPVHRMPSGAGHDAMKLHQILPQAMLFVRGENGGISHNPLESTTSDDMELAVAAFEHLLNQLAGDAAAHP
jgi:N-carbamoyl-L-amino-acid hydrolase